MTPKIKSSASAKGSNKGKMKKSNKVMVPETKSSFEFGCNWYLWHKLDHFQFWHSTHYSISTFGDFLYLQPLSSLPSPVWPGLWSPSCQCLSGCSVPSGSSLCLLSAQVSITYNLASSLFHNSQCCHCFPYSDYRAHAFWVNSSLLFQSLRWTRPECCSSVNWCWYKSQWNSVLGWVVNLGGLGINPLKAEIRN